jgi:hypothetical protein
MSWREASPIPKCDTSTTNYSRSVTAKYLPASIAVYGDVGHTRRMRRCFSYPEASPFLTVLDHQPFASVRDHLTTSGDARSTHQSNTICC